MSRPGSLKSRRNFVPVRLRGPFWIRVGLLIAFGLFSGCTWVQKRQEERQELCRQCIEQSFSAQQAGELDQARNYLDDALTSSPNHAEIWWNLAEISIQQDRYSDAIDELKRYVELQENDPHGHLRLAQLYYLQNDLERASTSLKEVRRRIPGNIDALMLSARLARKQGEPQAALTDYYHVLQVSPMHVEATLELTEMLLTRDDPVRAASILRELARQDLAPDDRVRTHLNLGIAYGQLERWETAVDHLMIAQGETEHPSARDRYRLAYAQYRAGANQQALEILLQLADAGLWSDRAEQLYATITGTASQQHLAPGVVTASLASSSRIILDNEYSSTGTISSPEASVEQESIVPPEWQKD